MQRLTVNRVQQGNIQPPLRLHVPHAPAAKYLRLQNHLAPVVIKGGMKGILAKVAMSVKLGSSTTNSVKLVVLSAHKENIYQPILLQPPTMPPLIA